LFHRTARLSLRTGARITASLFVALVAASLLSLLAALWTRDDRFAFLSLGWLCLVLPISTIPAEPPAWRRGILIACSACLALAFLALGLASFTGPDRSALALTGAVIVFGGGMLSTWVATGLHALAERSRSRRRR
jgi:peptidoglycan/LPS O-acetylase OafA/YrhL